MSGRELALRKEVEALRAENERLWGIEGKYNAVMAENERLRAEAGTLVQRIAEGIEENKRLRAEILLVSK